MECQTAEAMTTPMVKGRTLPDSRNESGRAKMRPVHEARAIGLQRLMASSVGAGRRILETATRASSVLSRPTAAMPSSTRPITTSQECRTVGLSSPPQVSARKSGRRSSGSHRRGAYTCTAMSDTSAGGRFSGQVVVVTGSAMGIGRATAIRFASEGAAVACLDIEQEKNEATAADASALGAQTVALACDVRSRAEQEAAILAVVERWGRIDVLVACAGMYVGGPLPDIPLERWDDLVAVNLTGVLVSNSLVSPIMIEQGRGAIINVSSMAGKTSWPNSAEYSATKSGVIGVTRSAAMELGPHGITVNAVCPGNTLTAMVRRVAAEIGATLDMTGDRWLAMRAEDTALKRLAEPEEIAGVIAFLASDDARYITGQSIGVDGGLILS